MSRRIKWQTSPKFKNLHGEYMLVWNSAQKGYQPIARNLSDKDVEMVNRAWNDWLWIDAGVESPCPWELKDNKNIESIETALSTGMSVDEIIKHLKKLPKNAILNETVCLTFENYK